MRSSVSDSVFRGIDGVALALTKRWDGVMFQQQFDISGARRAACKAAPRSDESAWGWVALRSAVGGRCETAEFGGGRERATIVGRCSEMREGAASSIDAPGSFNAEAT